MRFFTFAFLLMILTSCSTTQPLQSYDSSATELNQPEEVIEVESVYPSWVTELHQNGSVACAKVKQGNISQAQSVALAKAQANIAFTREANVTSSLGIQMQVARQDGTESVDSTVTQNTRQNTSGAITGYEIIKSELIKVNGRDNFCILYGQR